MNNSCAYFKPPVPNLLMWLLILLALLWCTISCSPLKRLERLEKRHPQLFNKENDTIRWIDTFLVTVPGTHTDTVVHWSTLVDTVQVRSGNLQVKVWAKNDSIYIDAKTDTLYIPVVREIKVPYTKYITYKRPRDALRNIILPIIVIVGIVIGLLYYLKRNKNSAVPFFSFGTALKKKNEKDE